MSVRSAEGAAGSGAPTANDSTDAGERRGGGGHRVHFEALVAVGEAAGRSGFEAESMDVSPEGMRLRTAYLPEIGDRLVCRFDGSGAEVVTEGEVIWRDEQDRGGEFGIRFLTLDERAAEMLRGMCAPPEAARADAAAGGSSAPRGTRVRLHIEGLGSPMKARVRETSSGEMLVGSNLEFLRVGRALEIEDVDHGSRREATIDHVRVEVDAETNVPQLVVSLRCEGMGPAKKPSIARITLPFGAGASSRPAAPERTPDAPATGAAGSAEHEPERAVAHTRRGSALAAPSHAPRVVESSDGARADDEDELLDENDDSGPARKGGLAVAGAKAAKASLAAAKKIGPALSSVGARAKGAMAMALMSIRMKRAEREEAKKAAQPRRTTAPAPGGALKSEGRRLVREDSAHDGDDGDAPPPAPRSNKKAAALGSVLGLIAVLAVFGLTRTLRSRSVETPAESASVTAQTDTPPALPAGNGPVSANVPLFGATPLSTTEAVPSIPTPPASGAAVADPSAAAPGDPGESDDEPGLEDDEGPGSKEWGNGRAVKSPVVLRIKMDGDIERINGASGAMGFTVSLPGRRSLSAASELARKDKRVASVNVVNNAHGAEVTVQFKDGVPAFLARAKGERLEIALGTDAKSGGSKSKKVAKADGDHGSKKKASTTKKAGDKSSKTKADAKKKSTKKP